jgi:hypothetical protein
VHKPVQFWSTKVSVRVVLNNKFFDRHRKKQEGCCTEIANASLGPRKNPRAEHAIVEDFPGTKKQRTSGAFGEATLVRYWIWLLLKLLI